MTTSYILYELARNPEIQSKLREEVRGMEKQISAESINKLAYLDAVVKEGYVSVLISIACIHFTMVVFTLLHSLRIHPAGPLTQRMALRDDIIPLTEPIVSENGEILRSVRVRAGQVRIRLIT